MLKNKRGSLQDVIFLAGVLLFLSLSILFGFVIMSNFNDSFQANDVIEANGKAASAQLTSYFPGVIDNVFLILAVGSAIAALVLASLVRVSPIFIPFFIIMLILFTFVTGILSNIYQAIAANSNVSAYADQLLFISSVMEFLPLFVAVIGVLMMMVLYKRNDTA